MITIIKKFALHVPQIKRVINERDTLKIERNSLEADGNALIVERDALKVERNALIVEIDALKAEIRVLKAKNNQSEFQTPDSLVELAGYNMFILPYDSVISRELLDYRVHEPQCTKLFSSLIKRSDVVFDLGSNLGYYALLSATKCKKVIAVEPIPENMELLKTNIKLNHLRNLLCLETAISTFNGRQKIYLSVTSNHHSMYPTYSHTSIMVPVKTLDTVLKENKIDKIDYLRMDIEGYEVELIDYMPRALRSKPKLFIELHLDVVGLDKAKEFLLKLRDLGYELQYVVDRDKDFAYYQGNDAVKQGITIAELIVTLSAYRVCSVFLSNKEK